MKGTEKVIFRDCVCRENKVFFFTEEKMVPVMLDLDNEKCTLLAIKNRHELRNIPFDLITAIGNRIYALERSGAYMCEYSLDTQGVRYIQIDCGNKVDANFALLQEEENYIYIFDRAYGVTIYDAQNDKIEKVPYPLAENEVITGCKFKTDYFLFQKNGNKVFKFSTSTKTWDTVLVNMVFNKVMHVAVDQENIYILKENGTIIRWDAENAITIFDVAQKYYGLDRAASRICITQNNIVVLPFLADDILMINKENFNLKVVSDYPEGFQYKDNNWSKYRGYCETETDYVFACRTSQHILKISKTEERISWIKSEVDIKEFLAYGMKFSTIEEKEGYLSFFLEELTSLVQ